MTSGKKRPAGDSAAQALYKQARDRIGQGDFEKARDYLERALALEETAPARHDLGVLDYLSGERGKAIQNFERAINANPEYDPSFANAGEIFLEEGRAVEALDCFARAMQIRPGHDGYKEKFIEIVRNLRFQLFNPQIKLLVTDCLKAENVDFTDMGTAWLSLLKLDPAFKDVYSLAGQKDYPSFRKALGKIRDLEGLGDSYFLEGLKKIRVPDPGFERFLSHWRRYLLEQAGQNESALPDGLFLALACALAQYCYLSEYIFDESAEERALVEGLTPGECTVADERRIAALACYVPLHTVPDAEDIAASYSSGPLAALVRLQIGEHAVLQQARSAITPLTPIEDAVSCKVRQQYEESPFPRWNSYSKAIYSEEIEGHLRGKKAEILVAGCGTGREAVELATVFPDAALLAVDLSLSSLAYARQKAETLGLDNITFRQGDILALGSAGKKFDYVTASGVLHHMDDPLAGWKVLRGLLKPRGLMRVSLYSARGRESIAEAIEIIRDKGYQADLQGIRAFRRNCRALLTKRAYEEITASPDFYAASECRDLLFHAQEHRLDLLQVRDYLHALNLEFLGFQLPRDVRKLYARRFPADPAAHDLENWAQFESLYPKTFIGMYRFWCRSPV